MVLKQRERESMEEQFLNFLSDDLLDVYSYSMHKHVTQQVALWFLMN